MEENPYRPPDMPGDVSPGDGDTIFRAVTYSIAAVCGFVSLLVLIVILLASLA